MDKELNPLNNRYIDLQKRLDFYTYLLTQTGLTNIKLTLSDRNFLVKHGRYKPVKYDINLLNYSPLINLQSYLNSSFEIVRDMMSNHIDTFFKTPLLQNYDEEFKSIFDINSFIRYTLPSNFIEDLKHLHTTSLNLSQNLLKLHKKYTKYHFNPYTNPFLTLETFRKQLKNNILTFEPNFSDLRFMPYVSEDTI